MSTLKTFILSSFVFFFACATPQQNVQESPPAQPSPPPEGCEFNETQQKEIAATQDRSEQQIEAEIREHARIIFWENIEIICSELSQRSPDSLSNDELRWKESCGKKTELTIPPYIQKLLEFQIKARLADLMKLQRQAKQCGFRADPKILEKEKTTVASDGNISVG